MNSPVAKVNLQLEAAAGASPESSTYTVETKRRRLGREATAILKEFYETHGSSNPTIGQTTELLAKIHALPEQDHFTQAKLAQWFARRRKEQREKTSLRVTEYQQATSNAQSTINPRFPSLDEHKLRQLRTIYDATPSRTPELIDVWAAMLKVPVQEILAWIVSLNASQPTSVKSPEPLSAVSTSFGDTLPEDPTIPDSSRASLIHLLLNPIASEQPKTAGSGVHPHTAEEFDKAFRPFEEKMRDFLQQVQDGMHVSWGFEPSLATET